MKKKLICAALALVMVIGLLPMAVFATAGEGVTVAPTGTWTTEGEVEVFTAEGKLSLVQSGSDGITGNNEYKFGYFPAIQLGDTSAAKYVIVSRGQNGSGLDKTYLNTTLASITESTQLPYTPTEGASDITKWCQVYAGGSDTDAWGAANSTYWPNASNSPITQIAVATENTDESTKTATPYIYKLYKFDFSNCEIELPFEVAAPTEAVLGKQPGAFQENIAVSASTPTLTNKTMNVTGKCVWVDEPWTEAGFPQETGNYMALKITPTSGFEGKFNKVMIVGSDKSEKELDKDDNTLLWQFDENHNNTSIGVKITFGDNQGHTGSTITYTLNVEGVTAATEPATEFTITYDANKPAEASSVEVTGMPSPVTATTTAEGKLATVAAAPSLTGYTFKGWFDAQTGGNEVTVNTVFTKSKTIYAQWTKETVTSASPTFTAALATESFGGKQMSAFQSNITVGTANNGVYPLTGTVKYISDWTEFNPSLASEQTGFYVGIAVPKTIGTAPDAKTVAAMKLSGKTAAGEPTTKEYTTADQLNAVFTDNGNNACNIVTFLGATEDASKSKTYSIWLKYGDEADYTEYKFSATGLTYEGEPSEGEHTVDVTGTATGGKVTASVNSELATSTIAAAKENVGAGNTATFVVKPATEDPAAPVTSGAAELGKASITEAKTENVNVKVEVPNVGSVTLAPAALTVVENAADDDGTVSITVSEEEKKAPNGQINVANVEGTYKITVETTGNVTWGTLAAESIVLNFPVAGAGPVSVYLDGVKLDDSKVTRTNGNVKVDAPHLSEVIIVKEATGTVDPDASVTWASDTNIILGTVTVTSSKIEASTDYLIQVTSGTTSVLFKVPSSGAGTLSFPGQENINVEVFAVKAGQSVADITQATLSQVERIVNKSTTTSP